MTRLFSLLYVGVLLVLAAAWYIHGKVSEQRARMDLSRVFEEAHGGGARLVARELDAAPPDDRDQVLAKIRSRFDYSVEVIPLNEMPKAVQGRFEGGRDIAHFSEGANRDFVAATLSTAPQAVRLGPFPNYRLQQIEVSLGGWMRLVADKLNSAEAGDRRAVLRQLQEQFDFPVSIESRADLPSWPARRIARDEDIVFYGLDPQPSDRWFAATPLSNGSDIVRFGPFPNFERIDQRAATTTLALILLPAALAIAMLLRPVARQLRLVEHAAKAIAGGDLSARVDERRVRAAKPLAEAFNHMAGRTEALVRTQRELLQAVSHEFRTPLSRMRFAIDLIGTAKDDEERQQRLDSLDAATEELGELVGELLHYVRTETAESQCHRRPVLVREAVETLIPKYATLHPQIDYRLDDEIDQDEKSVFADPRGFQRVLGNLLSNAGRHAKGAVAIRVASDGKATTIDVDDDGTGIPESDRQRVFEPFTRLDNHANGDGRGVGLGLALVKRIMTQHGGDAKVLSSPLGGCRIRTTWPTNDTDGESDSLESPR